MDTFGVTPKGAMDRRWQRPKPDTPAKSAAPDNPYLRLVRRSTTQED